MRIIHIVGLSNSGKTTFINTLIPELSRFGNVGVIKHLGDHKYSLEDGKDTTGFFRAGAQVSVGIDSDKSIIALRTNSLDAVLRLLLQQNTDFVIIEGF
jgi:molybdopterin-guanine dinucleotide biosynthesis protein MobB